MNQTVYAVTHDLPAVALGSVQLTAGKLYPIAYEAQNSFDIIDDAGAQVPCFWQDCAFGGTWTRAVAYEEPIVSALAAELTEARTTLSILRTQVMVELNRGAERWEGVPEKLRERLDAIDAALSLLNPEPTPAVEVVL